MKLFDWPFSRLRSFLSRAGRDGAGTTAIEFAFVAPITIALMLATLQASVIFLAKAYFESGAETAARLVLTNQALNYSVAQFKSAVCDQLTALFDCTQVVVELEPIPPGTTNLSGLLPTFDASGKVQGTPTVAVGAAAASPGTDMLLVVMYPWPVFGGPAGLNFANFGTSSMLLTSTQIFRIEPL